MSRHVFITHAADGRGPAEALAASLASRGYHAYARQAMVGLSRADRLALVASSCTIVLEPCGAESYLHAWHAIGAELDVIVVSPSGPLRKVTYRELTRDWGAVPVADPDLVADVLDASGDLSLVEARRRGLLDHLLIEAAR
jgi:hypothetical protein